MPRKMPDITRREPTPKEKDEITIDIEWLKARVTEDDSGCWVWNGFITKGGQPQCRITIEPKVSATMLVRRLVAKMSFNPTAKFKSAAAFMRNRQAGALTTCSWGCCHPDHVRMRTKVQAMKPRRGKPLPLSHKMRISAARRKNSNISDADIRRMMLDERPGNHVAAEYGVHPSYVPHVRTGKLRAFSTMGNNLFSGLLAPANGAFYDEEEAA
jgi:hypothetical protein